MITVKIYKYKTEEEIIYKKDGIEIKIILIKEIENTKRELELKDEKELNREIDKLIEEVSYSFASFFINKDYNIEKIYGVEDVAKFGEIQIGRIKDIDNIYIFATEKEELFNYFERNLYHLIEIKLNINEIEKVIDLYKKFSEKIDEEKVIKIQEINRLYLPFLKEMDKRLVMIKRLSEKEEGYGLFNKILMEIKEEDISTLETWINLTTTFVSQVFQIKLNKGIRIFSSIMGVLSLISLLIFYDKIISILKMLKIPNFLFLPIIIIFVILIFLIFYKTQKMFI
jgi:hypothetical protein